jgi:hypothetical protein
MTVIHVLAGLGLLGLSVYSLIRSLSRVEIAADHWKIITVFSGLLLAFVLFTGFIQLGSRHSVPRFVLYKLGATVTGGIILLLSLISRLKGLLGTALLDFALAISVFLFGISLYLGIVI